MTTERLVAIATLLDDERRLLVSDVRSAHERAGKAEPGDRIDIVRYEALSSALEAWAHSLMGDPDVVAFAVPGGTDVPGLHQRHDGEVPSWIPRAVAQEVSSVLEAGGAVVTLRIPLEIGQTSRVRTTSAPPPPAKVWKAPDGVRGAHAVEERFKDQLERALRDPKSPRAFSSSGVSNVVLTNALHDFVGRRGARIDLPAEYKDGSRAKNLFPMRSLKFLQTPRGPFDLSVRFALLSIRHTEMDVVVDGAWLRNIQISQQRAAAETDDLAYEISREQFKELTRGGKRVMMELYQTGLQPAIVGFYRALVDQLIEQPGCVSVRPMYFQEPRPDSSKQQNRGRGKSQGNHRGKPATESLETTSAHFQAGKVWATAPAAGR